MLYSFSHCDIGDVGPCIEEDTKYSHIREENVIVTLGNEKTLTKVFSF